MAEGRAPTTNAQQVMGPEQRTKVRFQSSRLLFDGVAENYERWEVKFLAHLRLQGLKKVVTAGDDAEIDADQNEEVFAELVQVLDDKSLTLVMREAVDDGRKAFKLLREHYASNSTPRIITLYTELTSLSAGRDESMTDYLIRAETAAAALKEAKETVSDALLIAMVLKGLPDEYRPFIAVATQKEGQTFQDFKSTLRGYEETEKSRAKKDDRPDSVLKVRVGGAAAKGAASEVRKCYGCGSEKHIAKNCPDKQNKVGKWCTFCQSKTHNDQNCRKKNRHVIKAAADDQSDSSDEHSFAFQAAEKDIVLDPTYLLVDTGATTHIVNDKKLFASFDNTFSPKKHFIELANGEKGNVAEGKGDVKIKTFAKGGKLVEITLHNALYCPTYPQNIFSVQSATEKGAKAIFNDCDSKIVYKDGTVFELEKKGRLFYMKTFVTHDDCNDNVCYTQDLQGWHETMGHCNTDDIIRLEGASRGMKVSGGERKTCEVCLQGKMTRTTNKEERTRSEKPMEMVHTDLAGPISPPSREGHRYVISFTDDFSGVTFSYFMNTKDESVQMAERFLADSAPYGKVKCLRSDKGTEFTSHAFTEFLIKHKIKFETSAPHSPHQNGVAERNWRTLFEMARCMLIEAKLDKSLWPYAVYTAAYTRNRCFNRRLKKTPFEALTGKKPNLANMRKFGSECYAYNEDVRTKLDVKCTKGIFVGYDRNSPAYLVYYPDSGKVKKRRLIKCLTQNKIEMKSVDVDKNADLQCDDNVTVEECRPHVPHRSHEENLVPQAQDDQRPQRNRKAPAYLADYETEFDDQVSGVDFCYKVGVCPRTYNEAINSENADKWQEAMIEEMRSLEENETFTLSNLPKDRQVVGGKWVYTMKESADGNETYKARYVAKGFSQKEGKDYHETFSPTANMTSIRTVMQIAAQNDLILHQMDVKTAYLNAPIDCEIYMEQAKGFQKKGVNGEKLVYKLNKSLYGLKQSGRMWNNLLHSHFIENDFTQCPTEHCVYSKETNEGMILILVWVDDLIVGGKNENMLNETKRMMHERFKMKDLGKLSYFLGIEFEQGDGYVKMNQRKYIEKILEKYDMIDCKPRSTPSEQKPDEGGNTNPVDPRKYREIIGSLIYLMMATRPDICWSVTKLSQHLSNPLETHWVAAKHVLRYLKATAHYDLCYTKHEDGLRLVGYSDADWASSNDRRSTSGYSFALHEQGPLISWKSRKQPTVALSSCEAEYIALAGAVQESLYLSQLIIDLGVCCQTDSVIIYEDNQGTIALANNPVQRQRSKHIDIKYHFIRSNVKDGKVVLKYCPTTDMMADLMTKPATKMQLEKFKPLMFG